MKYFHEMHILKLYQILNNEFISFYKFVSHNKEEQYEKITPDSYLSLYCRYVDIRLVNLKLHSTVYNLHKK